MEQLIKQLTATRDKLLLEWVKCENDNLLFSLSDAITEINNVIKSLQKIKNML